MKVYGGTLVNIISKYGTAIPPFLERCMSFMLDHSYVVGIFRVPGDDQEIKRLTGIIDATGTISIPPSASPFVIANVISRFLRFLKPHILDDNLATRWEKVSKPLGSKEPYNENDLKEVSKLIWMLSFQNKIFISRIFGFFIMISKDERNKMNVYNLSVPLAPILVQNSKKPQWLLDPNLVAFMLTNYTELFGDVSALNVSEKMNEAFFCQSIAINMPANDEMTEKEARMSRKIMVPKASWDIMFLKLLTPNGNNEKYFSRKLTPI